MREDKFQQVLEAIDRAVSLELIQARTESDYGRDNLTDDQVIRVRAWIPSEFRNLSTLLDFKTGKAIYDLARKERGH